MPFQHRADSPAPPPSNHWHPPPSNLWPPPWRRPSNEDSSTQGGIIAGLVIGFIASLLLFTVAWSVFKGHRNSRAHARAAAAAAARPRPPPEPYHPRSDEERQLRRARAPSQTPRLPAFTYSPSVKHNVSAGGEEAATCSVCLGGFLVGEAVRLLPVCLHLYHVGCIDPWLDAHSTCPLCRSDTDPTMDVVGEIPPV